MAADLGAYVEYANVEAGVAMGYLCPQDGTPCEFEQFQERYGDDADGNRGIWVTHVYCRKCHEPPP